MGKIFALLIVLFAAGLPTESQAFFWDEYKAVQVDRVVMRDGKEEKTAVSVPVLRSCQVLQRTWFSPTTGEKYELRTLMPNCLPPAPQVAVPATPGVGYDSPGVRRYGAGGGGPCMVGRNNLGGFAAQGYAEATGCARY